MAERHDETVAEKLEKRLERKKDELKWLDSAEKLGRRFQSFFGRDGVQFAEPGFKAHRNEYRALLVLVKEVKTLVFYRAVQKEDYYNTSKQKKLISQLTSNPREAKEYAMDMILQQKPEFA